MTMTSGTRLGAYEIVGPLGAGGMGEVYRARDTRLKRDVALKVLPLSFASDPDRLARFQREAEVLASLNHPRIGAIYGLEESAATHALILELVEGPTLADRLAAGAVPVAETLIIAQQIAEALEAAHEKGIIHRDLKPANIKLTTDGQVKVLDFGLAKLTVPADPDASLRSGGLQTGVSMSPTLTVAATGAGVILGTAAYMSPEQARGQMVDRRADIWAFGCVLYEMLTGKRTFDGDTATDVIAAIIRSAPDLTVLPADTPAAVRSLLRRCLQKDVSRRLQHIGDARIEIQDAADEPAAAAMLPPSPVARSRSRGWLATLPWAVSVVAVGAAAASLLLGRAPAVPAVARVELGLPAGVELFAGTPGPVTLSPDGSQAVFIGVVGGVRQLFLRDLDQFEALPIRGTQTANACFFSPDGRAVVFVTAAGELRTVSLTDGLVQTLTREADTTTGVAWQRDGVIFGRAGTLWRVPAAAGAARQLTTLDASRNETLHTSPAPIGDDAVLFVSVSGGSRSTARIEALTPSTGERIVVMASAMAPLYAPSGHLVFFRDGALLAAPFDAARLAVTGPPVRVLENVALDINGSPLVTVSASGTLAYAPRGSSTNQLVWVSRQGIEEPITATPRSYFNPRLDPGGRRVLVEANGDLWIQDTVRSTFTRVVSEAIAGASFPVWSPDGTRAVFRTNGGLYAVEIEASGRAERIPGTTVNDFPASFSPDGKTLVFLRSSSETGLDLYALSLDGDPNPRPVVKTPAGDGGGQLAPDGRWLAYTSDESGAMEVYLRAFPGPDRRWPVSTQGGTSPRWSKSGTELFYRAGDRMMVVAVTTPGAEPVLSAPRMLFEQRYAFGTTITLPNYDVTPDGQRFVMVKGESASGRLNVVLNWTEELRRLVP